MKYLDFNYETSKDYEKLFEDIIKHNIITFYNE